MFLLTKAVLGKERLRVGYPPSSLLVRLLLFGVHMLSLLGEF